MGPTANGEPSFDFDHEQEGGCDSTLPHDEFYEDRRLGSGPKCRRKKFAQLSGTTSESQLLT